MGVRIDIDYEGGLHCRAAHEPSGAALSTDAPIDNQGRGASFSPTDLVATALGSCMATIMGIVAQRHDWPLERTRLRIVKDMTSEGPRRIGRLSVDVFVPAALEERARDTLATAANTCPVRLSILPAIEVPVSFHWGADAPSESKP